MQGKALGVIWIDVRDRLLLITRDAMDTGRTQKRSAEIKSQKVCETLTSILVPQKKGRALVGSARDVTHDEVSRAACDSQSRGDGEELASSNRQARCVLHARWS